MFPKLTLAMDKKRKAEKARGHCELKEDNEKGS
jgi:hypothetical protein